LWSTVLIKRSDGSRDPRRTEDEKSL
jgi:hypothetical protein